MVIIEGVVLCRACEEGVEVGGRGGLSVEESGERGLGGRYEIFKVQGRIHQDSLVGDPGQGFYQILCA